MKNARLTVLLASERPEMLEMLNGVVEQEPDALAVGKADNAVKAVALADSLRPNVVLVDSELPHVAGSDGVRLSRIGGLDTSMSISQLLPRTTVILLNGADSVFSHERAGDRSYELCAYKHMTVGDTRVKLADLVSETSQAGTLVFASLSATKPAWARSKTVQASNRAMKYSGLTIVGGVGLMFTIIFAGAGALLAAAGAAGLVISGAVRIAAGLKARRPSVR